MKKMLLCCASLCVTLLLFCGGAFAAVEIQSTDSTVTVTKSADETKFTVRKEGVSDGQLYLVMIQRGDASVLPDSENLYYLNLRAASGTTFAETAYPKELTQGNYTVFLSDYSGTADGARSQVATLTVGGSGPVLCGDVDGNGTINGRDLTALARYCAENSDYMPGASKAINMQNANCNGDANGTVNGRDLTSLARHLAEVDGYEVLPH